MVIRFGPMATALLVLLMVATGCTKKEPLFGTKNFVGKWQSSRVTTPVYLYDDGEWELKTEGGDVQQYGVWTFYDNKILWTVRVDGRIHHDPNPVLSVTVDEFQLREKDGTVTTFRRF